MKFDVPYGMAFDFGCFLCRVYEVGGYLKIFCFFFIKKKKEKREQKKIFDTFSKKVYQPKSKAKRRIINQKNKS